MESGDASLVLSRQEMDGLGEAFFTIAPRLTMRPSASSCRFVSESRAAERPSLPIVWRKRQIEA